MSGANGGPGAEPHADPDDDRDRVAVTGTPGTGKTTATAALDDVAVHHVNDIVTEHGLHEGRDEDRDSLYADVEAVADHLGDWHGVAESHLAHHLAADRVVVLRCHPETLRERLAERGEPEATVAENAESEALDVVLTEAVQRHGADHVYEIDTTDRDPAAVAERIAAVVRGSAEPAVGIVDFTSVL
ncbi:MAG: adenylate kinase family protein [Halolamina sp.]